MAAYKKRGALRHLSPIIVIQTARRASCTQMPIDARFLPAQALRHAGAKRIGLLAVKDVVRAEYSIDTV